MPGKIRTVLGDVDPKLITGVVPHEHALLYGKSKIPRKKYIAAAMPALKRRLTHEFRELTKRGCNCFVECSTSMGIRTPELLREISRATGMHVVLSAGYYVEETIRASVRNGKVADTASFFMKEITEGIRRTGIRAGVVKVSSNSYDIEPTEKKVFLAAAAVHRKTGVPITTHTPKGARRHVDFLQDHGVDPSRVALGHIEVDPWNDIKYVARKGAMLIFTNWGGKQWVPENMIVAQIVDLIRLGYVRNIMISVDMYLYYINGRLKQRWPGGYLQIFDRVIPKLMKAGLKAKHIDTIIRDNPRRHLSF